MATVFCRIITKYSLVVLFLYTQCQIVASHECVHVPPRPNEFVHGVHIEPHHVMRKRSIDNNLRIHLVYDQSVSHLPSDKQNLIKNDLIPSAVWFWENTLKVRYTTGPLRLLRQCSTDRVRYTSGDPHPYCVDGCQPATKCGDTVVPNNHLDACREARYDDSNFNIIGQPGVGVADSDFILYVSAFSTDRCDVGTTVAYASYCQLESSYDRPVAGYVNMCPGAISTKAHDVHQMHSTIKHEILHALGFSAGLYAFFRDKDGQPLTPRLNSTGRPVFNSGIGVYQWSDRTIREVTRTQWKVRTGYIKKTVKMIITPKVVEEVRRHFACPTLEGAELEDQGVIGTALTHWEKRVFENEVMTGTYTQNPLISHITLALMEDTGWYSVDYTKAEPLQWGRGLGCDFVKGSCMEWMDKRRQANEHIHPYCDRVKQGVLQTECTDARDAVALCNLVQYNTELPVEYQHFHSIRGVDQSKVPEYAGVVVMADFCPYIQEFNWKKGEDVIRGSRCSLPGNNAEDDINYTLEQYGPQSRCFDQRAPWRLKHCGTTHQVEHWGSGCYEYECSATTGISVRVNNQTFRCYHKDQQIKVNIVSNNWLHVGTLSCPPCAEICQSQGVTCPADVAAPQRSTVVVKPPCNQGRPAAVTMTTITMLNFTALVLLFSTSICFSF